MDDSNSNSTSDDDSEDTTVDLHPSSHSEHRIHQVKQGRVSKPASKSRMSALDKCAHKYTKLNNWAPEVMKEAIQFFQSTRKDDTPPNILKIADKFGLLYTMLWKRIKGVVQGTDHQSGGKNVLRVFTIEDEKEFASIIHVLGECRFALTEEDIRSIAYEIAEERGYSGFNAETRKAGRKWTKGIIKHHPEIKVKTGHDVSIYRSYSANKKSVDNWFQLYSEILERTGITDPK